MSRRLKQLFAGAVIGCMMAIVIPFHLMNAFAANAKLSFSDPSVMVGNEVNVTMKVTSTGDEALSTSDIMLAYDPNVLEFISGTDADGGAGSIRVKGAAEATDQKTFSFTMKFKALQAGTTTVTVSSQEIYDVNSQVVTLDKQGLSTIKITPLATSSTDAALKSLKISPGTLTPEFSASVEAYTASVGADVMKMVVSGVAANAGAKVVIEGSNDLQMGDNNVVCRVTAEDGQTVKNYTILVNKSEGGETAAAGGENLPAEIGALTASVDGAEYGVATSFDQNSLPAGFESSAYSYKGNEVMAGKGTDNGLLLMYLADADGNGSFYFYNESADSFSAYITLETSAKSVVIIPLEAGVKIPDGLTETKIEIDGKAVDGWVWETDQEKEYCVVYGMNADGEKNFYRYDRKEKTVQRYFSDGAAGNTVSLDQYVKVAEDYNEMRDGYFLRFWIIVALGVLSLILLVMVIILMKRGGGRVSSKSVEDDDYYIDEYDGDEDIDEDIDERDLEIDSDEEEYLRGVESEEDYKEDLTETSDYDDFDDFEEEESLEDVEKALASRLAKNAEAVAQKETPKNKKKPVDEDDDFEFMDLDL